MSAELIVVDVTPVIDVIRILNPFDPRDHVRETMDWSASKTLADYFPLGTANAVIVSVSGKIVEEDQFPLTYLAPGDNLVICPIPQGGGKGGKSILSMIAMIAISMVAPQVAAGLYSSMGGTLVMANAGTILSVMTVGVTMAGSMLVNALLAPSKPTSRTASSGALGASAVTYGIDGAKNTSVEGIVVPVLYGEFRVGGNIVNLYVQNDGDTQVLYMRVVVSEGEISRLEDIELNDQPIANFTGVETDVRYGTSSQTIMNWFADTITPVSIGTQVTTGYTYYTTSAIDQFRVDLVASAGLYGVDTTTGGRYSVTVPMEIDYRLVGGTWYPMEMQSAFVGNRSATAISSTASVLVGGGEGGDSWREVVTITGWTWAEANPFGASAIYAAEGSGATITNPVALAHLNANYPSGGTGYVPINSTGVTLTDTKTTAVRRSVTSNKLPRGAYEIRIRRLTSNSGDANVADDVYISDINLILLEDMAFPNTAMLGVKIRLYEQLTGVPKVTFVARGKLVLVNRLPLIGGEPAGRNWYREYSTNPAWIVWDILTNTRYGGGMNTARLDLGSFQDFADYCNTAALTWNGPVDTEMNTWDTCQLVLRVGHAQLVGVGTRFMVVIEKADTAVMMFSVANMIENSFKESWLPISDRANEIEVTYFDKLDKYKQRTLKVYDGAALAAGRPQRNSAITLFGVTDHDTAYKEGLFQLNLNRYILQTIEFSAPLEAIACSVGSLIYVQHDMPQWGFGGRFAAGSTKSVLNLDREVTMTTGLQYKALTIQDALLRSGGAVTSVVGNSVYLSDYDGNPSVKRLKVGTVDRPIDSVFLISGALYGVIVDSTVGIAPSLNLLSFAERMDNAAWVKANSSLVRNAIVCPIGNLQGDKVVGNSFTGRLAISQNQAVTSGVKHTFSVYLKAGEFSVAVLFFDQIGISEGTYLGSSTTLNLLTGISSNPALTSLTPVGDGWYRAAISCTPTVASLVVEVAVGPNVNSATGNGVSGLYIAGPQLEVGAAATAYLPYGVWDTDVIEERDVVNPGTSTVTSITLQSALTQAPAQFVNWMFGEVGKVKKPFRVKAITGSHEYRRDITAIEYNASVYDLSGTPIPTPNYSSLNSAVDQAVIDNVDENLFRSGSNFLSRVVVHFHSFQESYSRSSVFASVNGLNYVLLDANALDRAHIDLNDGDQVTFKVVARDVLGAEAPSGLAPTIAYTVIGKTAPPANVTGLSGGVEALGVRLTWTSSVDVDLASYELRLGGTTWETASPLELVAAPTSEYLWKIQPAGSYVIRIKAIDTTGNLSETHAATTIVVAAPTLPLSLASSVVGNKVMLTWAAPASFSYLVDRYVIKYGASWAAGTVVTSLSALTYRVPVEWLGGRTFYVAAIDTAGNEGAVASVLATVNAPGAVTGVASAITGASISLSWNDNAITAGMLPIQSYEVRRGTSFDLGVSVLITNTTRQQIVVDWATASETFWVRATDINGNVGPATGNVVVSIGVPGAVTLMAEIVGTNAVISWTDSVQVGLPVAKYEVRVGGTNWATATLVASALNKSLTIPVTWVGDQTYRVAAQDTAGQYSTRVAVVVTVNVPVAPTINASTSQVGGTLLDQYRLAWSESPVDSTRLPIAFYSVGYGATTLGTVKGTSWMAKADWAAGRSFWVTAHDVNGNVSAQSGYTLTVTVPTAPTTLTLQVVDNNVLMYWSGSTSTLPITSYEIAKEATFNPSAPTTYIGKKSGGFTSVFETTSGAYTYYVRGIDSAGNNGTSKNSTATVSQPPDYVLNKNWNSTFSGTKSNAIIDRDGSLLLPVNLTQTWTTHFTDNAWTTPNDQIALYPNFAMPTTASGYYEEVFPYGTTLSASKITVTPTAVGINSPVVQCDISTSLDGVSYTTFTNVWSIYGTNFAYVKVRITVTATGANDQYDMSALNVTLDSKIKNDAGMLSCIANVTGTYTQALFDITVTAAGTWTVGQKVSLDFTTGAAPDGVYSVVTGGTGSFHVTSVNSVTIGTSNCTVDADGTPQLFSVPFIDVTSITVTPAGTLPRTVLYNFVDAANPTLFKVLLFDTAGARQPGTVSWSIKGY